jgi:signal transduction histidine kinase
MNWHFTPYAVPLFVGTAVLLMISLIAWQRRAVRGALAVSLLSATTAAYTLGYAFELGSVTLADAEFWIHIEYIGITLAPVCLFVLIAAYTGLERFLTPLSILSLVIFPAMTIIFAWTNNQHELIWQHLVLKPIGDRYVVDFTPGPWYWVSVAYIWLLMVAGFGLLVRTYRRVSGLFRRQVGIILAGTLIPFACHVLYLSGAIPLELDITPYGLVIVSLTLAWGILNYQFLDLMPIARRTVLEGMSDAVIVLDARDRVVDLNRPAQTLIAPDQGDYLGQPAAAVFPGWFAATISPQDHEKRAEVTVNQAGERRVFDMQLTPLSSHPGRFEGRLIALHDMTRRKQVEEERERLLAELDAFAHTVAHDLKTPLTVILGYGTTLDENLDGTPPEEVEEAIGIIARTAKKMNNIIDELLLLSSVRKMEEVHVSPLTMADVVAEARVRLSDMVESSGAVVTGPDMWPAALGYAAWVEEVWTNYISNAIKYGGTPPHVDLGATVQPDGMIRFWVKDNGRGLTPAEQARLFTEFARLRQVRAKGYGLGLSIVRRIVEKLGGTVGVEVTPEHGCEFYFTLPAAETEG